MKAADIPDKTFLDIVREFSEGRVPDEYSELLGWTISGPRWCQIWDLEERLPDIPTKVIYAKARSLIKRGLLDGCPCGCRGDFELPEYVGMTNDEISRAIGRTA